MSRLPSPFFQDENQQSPLRLTRPRQAAPGRAGPRPGRPHPFNTRAPTQGPFQQAPATQVSPLGLFGPQGPSPTPLGLPANAGARGPFAWMDQANPTMDDLLGLTNDGSVPPQASRAAAQQLWMQDRNALQDFLRGGGTQPAQTFQPQAAGAVPQPAGLPQPQFGGATGSDAGRLASLGLTASSNSSLPGLFAGGGPAGPQIGPETRREMAFSPEALAALETRGAESRANVGIRGISERFPSGISGRELDQHKLNTIRTARAGRKRTGTTRSKRRLGLPQEVRQQMVMNRAQGRRVPAWMAKIQVKLRKKQPLSAGENQLLQASQIAALPQQAQGQAFEAVTNVRHLMGVEARQNTPEAHQRNLELAFANQGQVTQQLPGAPTAPLSYDNLTARLTPTQIRESAIMAKQGDKVRWKDSLQGIATDEELEQIWRSEILPQLSGRAVPSIGGQKTRPYQMTGVPLF